MIFAKKKPKIPGEETKHTVTKIIVGTGIINGLMFVLLILALQIGFASDIKEIVVYTFHLSTEIMINLPISLIYINHTPNMKKYVIKSIKNGLFSIFENFIFLPIKIIDFVYHIFTSLKPGPEIYPTFD